MKKILKRILLAILMGLLVFIVIYAWPRAPIITAFAAKGMCSNVFIAGKSPERVHAEDLSFFPMSLAKVTVDYEKKTTTAKVFGLAKRTAVFREGLGAVIVLDTPAEELQAQRFRIPDPGYSQDTIPWPKGDIMPESLPAGVDYQKLKDVVEDAFDPSGSEPLKKTLGVAVIYKNSLIAEQLLDGYDAFTEFNGWSMTKSINSALMGVLTSENRININDPVNIQEWANDERGKATIKDIMHMNSGLEWVENYFTISEATLMLMRSEDMVDYVIQRPLEYAARTSWNYSCGDINLMSGIIRRAIGNDEEYYSLPYKGLFYRIGMLNTIVETDATGNLVASSYCYGTVRDWARFGLLYLNDGVFAGDTVLPPGWVDFTRQEAPNSNGKYAGTFWLKEPNPENDLKDVPGDVFFADGFLGQRVYIIPSEDLVVVRMGYSLKNFNLNNFLKDIISTLPT